MNESRRERILNLIGLGLLAVCFLLSLGRIFGRLARREDAGGKTTIRFAHWQLESGLRDAYERLATGYMRLHPEVQVEQIPIPESVFPNWLRTQLIGGTAPELIEIGKGDSNEILASYFDPVTAYLEQPNPYNRGNDLARTPWRDTFIDGLSHAYNQELLQYYTIPNSMFTVRVFYNRPLWREVFGSENLPRTYEEMVSCCEQAASYRTLAGGRIVPIAGSQNNAPFLIERLFSSQTQRLFYSLARPGALYPSNEELADDFLTGKWSFRTPAVHDGLELARGVGKFLPTGFLQLKREDALFLFSQGRALMTITGSWDAPSIHSQAPFDVGVFDVPVPTAEDPHYGRNAVGMVSEAGTGTQLSFGMVKQTSKAKTALIIDFLHFLTSRESNREFSEYSGWLPAVVGVEVQPAVRPFLPRMDGYPAGFSTGVNQGDGGGSLGAETARVRDTYMYRLFDPNGGADAYVEAIAPVERAAIISDLTRIHRDQLEIITRQDTTLAAYGALAFHERAGGEASGNWSEKVSELNELQTQEESGDAVRRWRFRQLGLAMGR